jgi:hypothetical protein
MECNFCFESGHNSAICGKRMEMRVNNILTNAPMKKTRQEIEECSYCFEVGHNAAKCCNMEKIKLNVLNAPAKSPKRWNNLPKLIIPFPSFEEDMEVENK